MPIRPDGIDTLLLFQYGSNMHQERFARRIAEHLARHAPSGTPRNVRLLGAARLDGWSLELNLWSATRGCRVLNLTPQEGAEAWGALYELAAALVNRPDGERSVVDRLEGHRTTRDPENYEKLSVSVEHATELVEAWTYIGLQEAVARCERKHRDGFCDDEYAEAVLDGARSLGLPAEYLSRVERVLGRS
jgi:hypothetical protein